MKTRMCKEKKITVINRNQKSDDFSKKILLVLEYFGINRATLPRLFS